MKNLVNIAIMGALLFAACDEVEVQLYDGIPYVNFYDENGEYRQCVQTKQSNFYYYDDTKVRDTVWFKLVSIATPPTTDVHVKLEAYTNTVTSTLQHLDDAEAGVHYVPFDSDEMKELLVFHANQLYDSIPVILLRDASLKEVGRRLTFKVVDSDEIKASDQRENDVVDRIFATLYMADCLSQPVSWSTWSFFLGTYGQVKHDFMIRHSGERWDDEFIEANDLDSYTTNSLQVYYKYKFRNELETENNERAAQGLAPLQESDGTVVTFPN